MDMDKIMDGCPEFLDLLWYARNVKQWPEEDVGLMVMTAGVFGRTEMRCAMGRVENPLLFLLGGQKNTWRTM